MRRGLGFTCGDGGFFISLQILGDPLLVGFETSLGLGVGGLPHGTLFLVVFHPLVGFRVGAFGVLVAAFRVVFGEYTVQRRIGVVGAYIHVFVSLLERQWNVTTPQVNTDNFDGDFVTSLGDLFRHLDIADDQFRDVYQAFDAVLNMGGYSEGHQFSDLARNNPVGFVGADEDLPRILLGGFEGQGRVFVIEVHVQDLNDDFLADLYHLGGMVDMFPGQFRDMHQAVDPAQVDENPKVDGRGDHADAYLTLLQS